MSVVASVDKFLAAAPSRRSSPCCCIAPKHLRRTSVAIALSRSTSAALWARSDFGDERDRDSGFDIEK